MEKNMFCFQCEQTAGTKGCTRHQGVCGKTSETAKLQDKLTGAVISLATCIQYNETYRTRQLDRIIIEALFTTVTNVNFDDYNIEKQIELIHSESDKICGPNKIHKDYDMNILWNEREDIRSVKSLLLFGLRGMSAYAYHAAVLNCYNSKVSNFMYKGLRAIAEDDNLDSLFSLILQLGNANCICMELLDYANIKSFGVPSPTKVPLKIEKGPFIVVSGHDLKNLEELLNQAYLEGVNIYTHGEMLPAHGYPELKKYSNLKGNFGTAWQNQQKEFDGIPAPVLFTSNCIMAPKPSYSDRVFTTGPVHYPGTKHLLGGDDYRELINKAIELGGYPEPKEMTGINGGTSVTTGWSYRSIFNYDNELFEGLRSGEIKHIFLVGGCDGAKPGRNYYTEFVQNTPEDSIVLTLACGKYRFNDMDLGTVAGIPRLLDMGKCNDAYGAIRLLVSLANHFQCGINELPVSIVLSWYEQKAVAVLLTLLSLGVRNIMLGPSLPACIADNIFHLLECKFGIKAITTPEEDLKTLLGNIKAA